MKCGYCGRKIIEGKRYETMVYYDGTTEPMHQSCYRAMVDPTYTKPSDRDIHDGPSR